MQNEQGVYPTTEGDGGSILNVSRVNEWVKSLRLSVTRAASVFDCCHLRIN
jgi:hypothetical protein